MKGLPSREELIRDVFLTLAPRWDVKDRATSQALARASADIADGLLEHIRGDLQPPKAASKKSAA